MLIILPVSFLNKKNTLKLPPFLTPPTPLIKTIECLCAFAVVSTIEAFSYYRDVDSFMCVLQVVLDIFVSLALRETSRDGAGLLWPSVSLSSVLTSQHGSALNFTSTIQSLYDGKGLTWLLG